MPIPPFNLDGIIPPFVGADGPGGARQDLSPYEVDAVDVVAALATSQRRREILIGWLDHRAALRQLGFVSGFQWLDGSFVEAKDPDDLDVVSYLRRPVGMDRDGVQATFVANPNCFNRAAVKQLHRLDVFFVDLSGTSEAVVDSSRYWCALFSHRRGDFLWKGMLKVDLAQGTDEIALERLRELADGPPAEMAPP